MSGKLPHQVPDVVVGILRGQIRQHIATIATLRAKTQGQSVEIEQLRAALERREVVQAVESRRDA